MAIPLLANAQLIPGVSKPEEFLEKGIFPPAVFDAPAEEEPGFFGKTFNAAKNALSAVLEFFGIRLGEEIRVMVSLLNKVEHGGNTATAYGDVLGTLVQQVNLTIEALEEASANSAKSNIALARAQETIAAVSVQSQEMINYVEETEADIKSELSAMTSAGYSESEADSAQMSFDNVLKLLREMGQAANQTDQAAEDLGAIDNRDISAVAQYTIGFRGVGDSLDGLRANNRNLQKMLAEKTGKQKVLADKDRERAQETSDSIAQAVQEGQRTANEALKDGVIDKSEQKALNKIAANLNESNNILVKATRGTDEQTQANAQGLVSASKNTSSTLKGLSRQTNVSSDVATAVLSNINIAEARVSERKSDLEKSTATAKGIDLLLSLIMEAARSIRPETTISQLLSNDFTRNTSALTGGNVLGYAVNNTNDDVTMSLAISFNDPNDNPVASGQAVETIRAKTIRPIYAEAPTGDQGAFAAASRRLTDGSYAISSETQNGREGVGLLSGLPKPLSSTDQQNIRDTVEKAVSGLSMARGMAQQRMELAADLAERLFGEMANFFGGGGHLDENGVANLPSGMSRVTSAIYSPDNEPIAFGFTTTANNDSISRSSVSANTLRRFENGFNRDSQPVILSVAAGNHPVVFIGDSGQDYSPDRQYSFRMADNPCAESDAGPILQNHQPLSNPFAALIPRALAYSISDPGGYGGGGALSSGEWVFESQSLKEFLDEGGKLTPEIMKQFKDGGGFRYRLYQYGTKVSDLPPWKPWFGGPKHPVPNISYLIKKAVSKLGLGSPPPPPGPVGGPLPVAQPKPSMIGQAFSKAAKSFIKGAGTTLAVTTGVAILGQGCASEDQESAEEHSEQILQDIADYADEQSQQGNDIEAAAAGVVGTVLDALNNIGGGVAVSGLSNLWDLLSGGD